MILLPTKIQVDGTFFSNDLTLLARSGLPRAEAGAQPRYIYIRSARLSFPAAAASTGIGSSRPSMPPLPCAPPSSG